jgi:catechol-2,3-dioxygenase
VPAGADAAAPRQRMMPMDWTLEVVVVPVADVDRAKRFYSEQVGFNVDYDTQASDEIRNVQLTPPGSGCSIVLSTRSRRPRPARWMCHQGQRRVCNWSSRISRPPATT